MKKYWIIWININSVIAIVFALSGIHVTINNNVINTAIIGVHHTVFINFASLLNCLLVGDLFGFCNSDDLLIVDRYILHVILFYLKTIPLSRLIIRADW